MSIDISARGCVHPYQYLCVCVALLMMYLSEKKRECVYKNEIKVLTKQDASDVDSLQKEKFLT